MADKNLIDKDIVAQTVDESNEEQKALDDAYEAKKARKKPVKKKIEMNCSDCGASYMADAGNVNLKRKWGQKNFYCPNCRRGRSRISFGE